MTQIMNFKKLYIYKCIIKMSNKVKDTDKKLNILLCQLYYQYKKF